MNISIIIPVALDCEGLKTSLDSLSHQLPGQDCEVIVVNDGGHESIRDLCTGLGVRCLDLVPNGGSYAARNLGARESRGDILGFIDAGVVACGDWITRAIEGMRNADYLAGSIQHPAVSRPTATSLYQLLFAFKVGSYLDRVGFGPTANLVMKRQVFEELGGFDDRLRSSGDLEFGDRVRRLSRFRQAFDPSRYVVHPFRSFRALRKKHLRVAMGKRLLAAAYPGRFSAPKKCLPDCFHLMLPPWDYRWLVLRSVAKIRCQQDARHPACSPEFRGASFTSRIGGLAIIYLFKWLTLYITLLSLRDPNSFEWDRITGSPNPGNVKPAKKPAN